MSEIVKTEAIVLTKINYSDTSKIVNLFTKEFGRITAIVKGGRNKNSKIGMVVDPMNIIDAVIYNKPNREIQLLTGADLISHFPDLKEDYTKLQYAFAVLELLNEQYMQEEPNNRLFVGVRRILELLNTSNEDPQIIFLRFFLFFLKELGFEINVDSCPVCNSSLSQSRFYGFLYTRGIICGECVRKGSGIELSGELFELYNCLKLKKSVISSKKTVDQIQNQLLHFLEHHSMSFKGLKSLKD